jgi:thymidylate synthase (FAD)
VQNVFFEPKVYLVSRPALNWEGIAQLLVDAYGDDGNSFKWRRDRYASDGEWLCELMGRLCYNSFGEKQGRTNTKDYLENILDLGHGSVLEHASYSFVVTQCTRGFTHQLVRHRHCAISQESQHFNVYGEDARLCFPGKGSDPDIKNLVQLVRNYLGDAGKQICEMARRVAGKKKDVCAYTRDTLPNCVESKIGFTGNIRALRHFVEVRGSRSNIPEIRMVAAQVLDHMRAFAPLCFPDYTVETGDDGYPVISSKWRKV